MSTPITAALVNELRKRTDLPLMDCKSALVEAGGDIEKAIELLRIRNTKFAAKRSFNETAEGRVGVFIDPSAAVASIVEVRCESAPVVKSDHFIALLNDIAKAVAAKNPATLEALLESEVAAGKKVSDRIGEVIGLIRENMKVQRFARLEGGAFGHYIHHDGSLGVLFQADKAPADADILKSMCMHIAAASPVPVAATRESVDPALVEKERSIAKAKAEATGKPPQIAERIAEGQLKTWFAENVLVEQPYVMDPAATVGQKLKAAGINVLKFVRYKVGEVTA